MEDLEVHLEFYTLLESTCDAVRCGPKLTHATVAATELIRIREILHKLRLRQLKLKEQGKQKVKADE